MCDTYEVGDFPVHAYMVRSGKLREMPMAV
jgi:hypothetical protein